MNKLRTSDTIEPSPSSTHKDDEAKGDGHKLVIRGFVTIENGKTRITMQNKELSRFYYTLLNLMSCSYLQTNANNGYPYDSFFFYDVTGKTSFVVLGRNTTTVTTPDMTALVDPIGATPGNKATTVTVGTANPSLGTYQVTMTASYPAGSITNGSVIGEVGLYGYAHSAMKTAGGWAYVHSSGEGECTVQLMARACVADSEFAAVTVDSTKPTTITWAVVVSYQ